MVHDSLIAGTSIGGAGALTLALSPAVGMAELRAENLIKELMKVFGTKRPHDIEALVKGELLRLLRLEAASLLPRPTVLPVGAR